MTNKSKEHLFYIDGLKGLSCLFIMIGHYFGAYKYAQITSEQYSTFFEFFKNKITSNIVNEALWLQLFFLISGFLIASGKTDSIKTFAEKSLKRFLRFYLPIVSACFIIYFLIRFIGIHASETSVFFDNSFFQGYSDKHLKFYEIILDPIKTIFSGGSQFNSPYWVISDMFYASIIMYALLYIKQKTENNFTIISGLLITLTALFFIVDKRNIAVCIIGMALRFIQPSINRIIKKDWLAVLIFIFSIAMPFFGGHYILSRIAKHLYPAFPSIKANVIIFYFSIMLLFVNRTSFAKKILSSKPFVFLGKISFGIYSFHWPVYISIGALIMMRMLPEYSLFKTVTAASAICIPITVILAILYHYTFENYSMKLIGKIKFQINQKQ